MKCRVPTHATFITASNTNRIKFQDKYSTVKPLKTRKIAPRLSIVHCSVVLTPACHPETRGLRFLIYFDTWEWGERANWGGANMRIVCGGHFWHLGSIASLATETTGGVILVAFWPKHGLRIDLRVPIWKFFGGEMPPDPPSLQWPYQSKTAGSSPAQGYLSKAMYMAPNFVSISWTISPLLAQTGIINHSNLPVREQRGPEENVLRARKILIKWRGQLRQRPNLSTL